MKAFIRSATEIEFVESSLTNVPALNGVVERTISLADTIREAVRIQGSLMFGQSGAPKKT